MTTPDFDRTVAFYSPFTFPESTDAEPTAQRLNPDTAGNGHVIAYLADLGVGSVYVDRNGFRDLNSDHPSAVGHLARIHHEQAYYLKDQIEMPLGENGITAVRARSATPRRLADHVPVINNAAIRAIGASKMHQYELFGTYMAPSVFIGPGERLETDVYETFKGDMVAVKGNSSKASKQLKVTGKSNVPQELQQLQETWTDNKGNQQTIVVQQYEPGRIWPSVRPLSSEQIDMVKAIGNHELRLYAFATPSDLRLSACLKLNAESAGAIAVGADIDTVPADVIELAGTVCERLFEETDAPGFIAGIDLYANEEMSARIREINLRDPGLVFWSKQWMPHHLRQHAFQLAELALHHTSRD